MAGSTHFEELIVRRLLLQFPAVLYGLFELGGLLGGHDGGWLLDTFEVVIRMFDSRLYCKGLLVDAWLMLLTSGGIQHFIPA